MGRCIHRPKLPKGYAPFGIQTLNGMVFVTYAKTQAGSDDEKAGRGRGIVDAYATNGAFLGRVASHGQLNAPWGLAWAPSDFGRFSGPARRQFRRRPHQRLPLGRQALALPRDAARLPRQEARIDGLWAIAFGGGVNVANDGAANTLFFAAGPHDEEGGAFGTITADAP